MLFGLIKSGFTMPSSLTAEEIEIAYKQLFNLERKTGSLTGRVVFEIKRFWIYLFGSISNCATFNLAGLNENQLHVILKCFRSNFCWAQKKEQQEYLKKFTEKNFSFLLPTQLLETQSRLIYRVCVLGNITLLKEVLKLEEKNDLNWADPDFQRTPLMGSAGTGKLEIVKFLYQQKLDLEKEATEAVTGRKTDALEQAVYGKNVVCIQFLLENGKFSPDSIFRALKAGLFLPIDFFLYMLDKWVATKELNQLEATIKDSEVREILYLALHAEHYDLFKSLLAHHKISPHLTTQFIASLDTTLEKEIETEERIGHFSREQTQEQLKESLEKARRRRSYFGTYTLIYHFDAAKLKTKFLYPSAATQELLKEPVIRQKLAQNSKMRHEILAEIKESLNQADEPQTSTQAVRLELAESTRDFYNKAIKYLEGFE